MLRLAVAGALGRMGQAVAAAAQARADLDLIARFDRPEALGEGLTPVEAALAHCDVVVDFTSAAASSALAKRCAQAGGPALVIGSTGFSQAQEQVIGEAAQRLVIVRSGNFSLAVNLLMGLVRQAAAALPAADYDIEIFEAHHRHKSDAPSGTALMLGDAAAAGRERPLSEVKRFWPEGDGGRHPGAIGFSVARGGGIVGEHAVSFCAGDEILTLSHSARERGLFARGALAAAVWTAGRSPGLYTMQDVLGLSRGQAQSEMSDRPQSHG